MKTLFVATMLVFMALVIFIRKMISGIVSGSEKARKAAEELGITIEEVERHIAVHYSNLSEMRELRCVEYSIPRNRDGGFNLKLLQRFRESLKYSGYWEVVSEEPIGKDLELEISKFKEFFSEELGELEVDNSRVSIFWEEWGNEETVQDLFRFLEFFASYKA